MIWLPLLSSDPVGDMVESFKDTSFRVRGPTISSMIVMTIVLVLAIVVGVQANRQDPTKPSKGLLGLAEHFLEWLDKWTAQIMGKNPGNWPGYFLALFVYLFLAFIWSITGLPSIIDTLIMPLSLSLVMFVLIQVTGLRYQKLKYFHRYIEPIAPFLPINLVTMWTPIISTTLRMFGNCLAGSVIIGLVNWALKNVSVSIVSAVSGNEFDLDSPAAIILGPLPIAVLNLYFGLFSGGVQTLVFASLNGVWIGNEIVENDSMGTTIQATRAPADNVAKSI